MQHIGSRLLGIASRLAASALFCALATFASPGLAAPTEAIVRLPSEGGATLPYLLGQDDAHPPLAAAILFTGGAGVVGLLTKGIPHPGANFLVRSRARFLEQGIATAVIDVPTDTTLLSDAIRMSARHARDVEAVVADLGQRFPGVPVHLVGTSRGTVSAASAGAALGTRVAGVVLTSTIFNASRGGAGLASFDYASIRAPLLFVHHTEDACAVTPYAPAQALGRTYPLVSVSGGAPARSEPCEAFSPHGYLGVEAPTVAAISAWILGRPYPKTIP
jgi:pimeloyl-ACP methyl ester carboxylesterase